MRHNRLLIFGGMCAIVLGITGALASLVYLLLPAEQRLGVPAASLLPSQVQNGRLLNVELLLVTLTGVVGLPAVPAISRLVRAQGEGWIIWTSNLTLLQFGVQAVSNFLTYLRLPGIAAASGARDHRATFPFRISRKNSRRIGALHHSSCQALNPDEA